MIYKLLESKKYVSFPSIGKTRVLYSFLAYLCVIFLLLGLSTFFELAEDETIMPNLKGVGGMLGAGHFFILSIFFFATLLFVLYRFLLKPMVEISQRNSEEQHRQIQQSASILENNADLIWAIDTNYRLIACNSSFVKSLRGDTGVDPKIGDNILEISYSHIDFSKRKKLYDRALNGESFETEFKCFENGRTRHYELSYHPIYDNNKTITGCSIFRKDITRRVEMYLELRESEEHLKEAQKIANVGHWNWDMVKDELEWSDQLYKVFGLNPETFEANYEGLMDIIHPEDQEAFGKSIENCLTNNDLHDVVHRIVMPDGSIRHVHQKGKAYHVDEDTPVRMAGTIHDVTLLEEARLQIMQQYNELENFVYIISHNVRSPISTLQGLVDMIEPGNEALNMEVIPSIVTTVDTLDRTIKDLNHSLSLKNIKESSFEQIDLRKVLQDIEHLLALDISSSKANIVYDLSELPKVTGIKSYYTNILFNLIMNSIKYRAQERPLQIKVTSRCTLHGGMKITVSDNGIGMKLTTERKKRIFDMYGRLSGASEGRGMGLYLAKAQVEVMNGTLDVESEPNQGTTFIMTFKKPTTSL